MSNTLKSIVNPYKRSFFKLFTSSFKNSKHNAELSKIDRQKIKRVLVTRPNHRLGNQLLLSPLLQTLEEEFPAAKVDLLVNGTLSNILFQNYDNIGTIHSLPKKPFKHLAEYISVSYKLITINYDLAIVGIEHSNSSKIFVKLSRARYKIFDSGKSTNKSLHIAKIPIDNLMAALQKDSLPTVYPKLDFKLDEKEIKAGKKVLSNYYSDGKPIVAIFTNATGEKKHSKEWWNELCAAIEKQLPDAHIFEILPKENTSQVDFKYKSYLSNELREIASVIENCSVFIGADSGVMHLATATQTPTFGLFNGVKDPENYKPYGHHKYVVDTTKTTTNQLALDVKKAVL
jgi:ADP-heptose:LPS heptosyltransferase